MQRVRLLILAVMALFALSAFAATTIASAEEDGVPRILILEEGKATELEATPKGEGSTLATLAGKMLVNTATEAKLKGCDEIVGSPKDVILCKDVAIHFTGVKQGAVACRSEMADGTQKDPIETVLALLDLHIAAEESGGKLQPMFLVKVLGVLLGEEELTINCGGVKNKVKGIIPCLLLPGLEMIKKFEVLCKQNATTHDQETGKCEKEVKLCETLTKEPFLSNLGAGFEDAGMSIHLKGEFTKDVFIDD